MIKILKNEKSEIKYKKLFQKKSISVYKNDHYFKINEKIDIKNRRISIEVKRVFMSCQIILLILDIRNPLGTWPSFLNQKNKNKTQKILLVLNKCDLVPFWVVEKWLKIFSINFLVFGFFCKKHNENEKMKILCVLRKIKKKFYTGKKKIFIGVIGYPNVGKSSFINNLIGKKCLRVSPVPGQTKMWQFVKLSKEIFLIDSPGMVLGENFSRDLGIIKGTRKIENTLNFNPNILKTLECLTGKIENNKLSLLISNKKINKKSYNKNSPLMKGGQTNESVSINKILKDFISGNLPWFSPIPSGKNTTSISLIINKWFFSYNYI